GRTYTAGNKQATFRTHKTNRNPARTYPKPWHQIQQWHPDVCKLPKTQDSAGYRLCAVTEQNRFSYLPWIYKGKRKSIGRTLERETRKRDQSRPNRYIPAVDVPKPL